MPECHAEVGWQVELERLIDSLGPRESVTPWAADTGGFLLFCRLFLHVHRPASEGKLGGVLENVYLFCHLGNANSRLLQERTLLESISSKGSFHLYGKRPHTFSPEGMQGKMQLLGYENRGKPLSLEKEQGGVLGSKLYLQGRQEAPWKPHPQTWVPSGA